MLKVPSWGLYTCLLFYFPLFPHCPLSLSPSFPPSLLLLFLFFPPTLCEGPRELRLQRLRTQPLLVPPLWKLRIHGSCGGRVPCAGVAQMLQCRGEHHRRGLLGNKGTKALGQQGSGCQSQSEVGGRPEARWPGGVGVNSPPHQDFMSTWDLRM